LGEVRQPGHSNIGEHLVINVIRLVTVHPFLVHFTIGILPVMVLGYAAAVWFKSERWSFVGDAATVACAGITLLTMSFGLISNFYLRWPGGLWFWHYLHMGLGIGSTVALVIFATIRLITRRRVESLTSTGALIASIFVSILIAATGWIGGEILVYTSGMAVQAAGNGAFAPIGMSGTGTPVDFPDAMGRTRAAWASITTQVAEMIVQHPSDAAFSAVAKDAQRLEQVANWISTEGPKHVPGADKSMNSLSGPGQSRADGAFMTRGQLITFMGAALEDDAETMARQARQKDLEQLAKEVGRTSSLCVSCHEQLRWRKHVK
jgi:uncharacterized membrane protein